jgi:hypothetical protein
MVTAVEIGLMLFSRTVEHHDLRPRKSTVLRKCRLIITCLCQTVRQCLHAFATFAAATATVACVCVHMS